MIALPRLVGPATPGLPHGANGFIPVDAHGRVPGVADVFAAGDATTFPLKQGGLATQQADAAAEAIAADLGAAVTPAPFRPVLRGLLLTGGAPLYLRSTLSARRRARGRQRHAGRPPSEHRRLAPGAVVAAEQDRRPLPRAAAGHGATAAAAGRADAGLQRRSGWTTTATTPANSRCCWPRRTRRSATTRQALRALDAAAALTGGVLPEEWAERREQWKAAQAGGACSLTCSGASASGSLDPRALVEGIADG